MKAYLPFGDLALISFSASRRSFIEWISTSTLIYFPCPSSAKYSNHFFEEFANNYEESWLSNTCWQALIDNYMPVSMLINYDEINDWHGVESIEQALELDCCPTVSLAFIIQAFIWLLNQYGANIMILPEDQDIPQINNWTCPGFETVGYGCFYD